MEHNKDAKGGGIQKGKGDDGIHIAAARGSSNVNPFFLKRR